MQVLDMHPAIKQYTESYFGKFLFGPRQSVSLHLMLTTSTRSSQQLINTRRFPSKQWYEEVFFNQFKPADVIYVVVADDAAAATVFMEQVRGVVLYY
jgi:hypothetical protein